MSRPRMADTSPGADRHRLDVESENPRCPQKASSSAGTSLEWHSLRERTKRAKGSQTPAHPKLINRLRDRWPTVRRVIQNVADVDDIHLPSQAFVGGVYGYYPSIPAEPRMQINPVYAFLGCRFQFSERNEQFCWSMIHK